MLISLVVFAISCGGDKRKGDLSHQVHLLVDANTIKRGDWVEIAAPMYWWVNVHAEEELYRRDTIRVSRDQRIVFAARVYLEETVRQGHQWFFSSTSTQARTDVADGLAVLGLKTNKQIYDQALLKINGMDSEEPDFSDEDSGLIQSIESPNHQRAFLQYVSLHEPAFYFDQRVDKPDK